ncbi:MAG: adenine phosphoribosyltransferase [Candidatus Neomarinimicrobiota bacterium]
MNNRKLRNKIRTIPDFPKTGIQFRDITTLLLDNDAFTESIDIFCDEFKDKEIDVIVGIESRGFIFASPLALKLGCALAIARKPGKLPGNKISVEYDLEYGTDTIEMHTDAVKKGNRVLIVDDLLATGGTAKAVGELVRKLKGDIVSFAFLINLLELKGVNLLKPHPIFYIVEY